MGWCHEFVLQVREGCDHPMVAGESACHCAKCGMVCKGRFAGCAAVWERGPIDVPFDRIEEKIATMPALFVSEAAPRLVPSAASDQTVDTSGLRPLLQAIRAELEILTRKLDQASIRRDDLPGVEQTAIQLLNVAEELPARIVNALAAALETQHRSIMADVREAINAEGQTASMNALIGLPARLAGQLDDIASRYSFQLDELMSRIKELIDTHTLVGKRESVSVNGAILAEIDQLTRVVAGTIELLGHHDSAVRSHLIPGGMNGTAPSSI